MEMFEKLGLRQMKRLTATQQIITRWGYKTELSFPKILFLDTIKYPVEGTAVDRVVGIRSDPRLGHGKGKNNGAKVEHSSILFQAPSS